MGDRALLVELDSLEQVHQLLRAVRAHRVGVDAVPAWTTLLVTTDGDAAKLAAQLRELADEPPGPPVAPTWHEIPVVYDGEDLASVAAAADVSIEQVIELHTSVQYVVAFLGFSRGFPYLTGVPAVLRLPRLSTPRVRVPAGSVAIAQEWCGIYPSASPGGWHLLGHTDHVVFDPAQTPPTPFVPGDRVSFVRA